MKVKAIYLPCIFQVIYVLCFIRLRYQVSVCRTIGPLVLFSLCFGHLCLCVFWALRDTSKRSSLDLHHNVTVTYLTVKNNPISCAEVAILFHVRTVWNSSNKHAQVTIILYYFSQSSLTSIQTLFSPLVILDNPRKLSQDKQRLSHIMFHKTVSKEIIFWLTMKHL